MVCPINYIIYNNHHFIQTIPICQLYFKGDIFKIIISIYLSNEASLLYNCLCYNQNHPCERVVCSAARSLYYWPTPKGASNGSPTALLFQLTLKGSLLFFPRFSLYLFTCKWIDELFHTELICNDIILYLISNIFFNYLFISTYRIHIKSSTPKFSVSISIL